MKQIINKILDREMFFYVTFLYLIHKYIFYYSGPKTTYALISYAVLIFLYDFWKHKGIYKFNGYIFSYLMCFSVLLSSFVVGHKIFEIQTIKGLSIFFVNFFMYLPLCFNKNEIQIKNMFERILKFILYTSFFINIIGVTLALFGVEISLFGTQFGARYGIRLVTVRETANETAWFAILSACSSIYFLLKNNKWKIKDYNCIFYFCNLIIQIITYILSGNRSSIFGVSFGLIIALYAYFYYKQNKKVVKKIVLLFFVFAVLGGLYVGIRVFLGKGSDSVRFDMYKYGIILLLQTNVIFGSSYVNLYSDLISHFDNIYNNYFFHTKEQELRQLTADANAHNVFIQQLNTHGLIGLFILIGFFVYVFNIIKTTILKLNNNNVLIKLFLIFFICFGFVVGNISWNIVSTMTCFVNLLFFFSISALIRFLNINKENENASI